MGQVADAKRFFYQTTSDGAVKSPISALRSSRRPCGVRQVRLRTRNFARLDLELFTAPSGNQFLRVHQLLGGPDNYRKTRRVKKEKPVGGIPAFL